MKILVGFHRRGYGWSAAKDWSNCGFWYLWLAWNHFLKDNEGQLDSCVPVLGSLRVSVSWGILIRSVSWGYPSPADLWVSLSLCSSLLSSILTSELRVLVSWDSQLSPYPKGQIRVLPDVTEDTQDLFPLQDSCLWLADVYPCLENCYFICFAWFSWLFQTGGWFWSLLSHLGQKQKAKSDDIS